MIDYVLLNLKMNVGTKSAKSSVQKKIGPILNQILQILGYFRFFFSCFKSLLG
jgi:hypothetical protein